MLFIYLIFIVVFIFGVRFVKDNKDYLDKDETTIINGLFVITIFFSHFQTYIAPYNIYDEKMLTFLHFIGQLMVTSFFFYSGYGIYESIKNKKNYMNSFFKKRFIPTFVNFLIAILLFIIVNLIMGNNYSIEKILLSFTGYESIGNSNWYMLAIFVLYFLLIICFNKKIKIKNLYRIILFSLLVIIYMYIISRFKETYYVNTVFCFPIGMFYSYYKDKINNLLERKYYLCLSIMIALLIGSYFLKEYINNIYTYNAYAICFIIFIVLLTRKLKIKSTIFTFFGVHTFWIYILQRIPMIILKDKLNNYVYFVICLTITMILSFFLKKITDKLWKKIYNKKGESNENIISTK